MASTKPVIKKRIKVKLTKRFHFGFLMTALHIVTIFPYIACGLIEPYYPEFKNIQYVYLIFIGIFSFAYLTLSPILILIYMPTVSSAVRNFLIKISKCIDCF